MNSNDELKQWIADLRGNIPTNCDFCGEPRPFSQLHPEEGGDWACDECIERWEKAPKVTFEQAQAQIRAFNAAYNATAPLAGGPALASDGQNCGSTPQTPKIGV